MNLKDLIIKEKLLELRKKWLAYKKSGDTVMAGLVERQAKLLKMGQKARNEKTRQV